MRLLGATIIGVLALMLAPLAQAAQTWTEGTHYTLISPVQKTTVPAGKVEVMEVFSYACTFCNRFQPVAKSLQRNLPATAQLVFLPAAFIPTEDWPMFQRAYFTAQALKLVERTHQAIFAAVWETGELGLTDSNTGRPKNPMPSIEDAAKTYERLTGVKADVFLATAKSPAIDQKMAAADAQIVAMQIPGTPSLVVNGKYRVNLDALHTDDDIIDLVHFLVDKESHH
jgi:thiol:disulfide interchange protein DsbA